MCLGDDGELRFPRGISVRVSVSISRRGNVPRRGLLEQVKPGLRARERRLEDVVCPRPRRRGQEVHLRAGGVSHGHRHDRPTGIVVRGGTVSSVLLPPDGKGEDGAGDNDDAADSGDCDDDRAVFGAHSAGFCGIELGGLGWGRDGSA